MKPMRSLPILAIGGVLLAVIRVEAQSPSFSQRYTNVTTYAVSFPSGDTRQFVNGPSWVGVTWEGQWGFHSNAVAGFSLGVYDFAERSKGTTNYQWGAVTGTEFRDLVAASLMGTGRWFLRSDVGLGPYVGLGAGFLYAQQSYQLGVASQIVRSGLQLAAAPEAGFAMKLFDGVDAVVNARYMLPSAAGRYVGGGSRSFQFFTLGVGLAEH